MDDIAAPGPLPNDAVVLRGGPIHGDKGSQVLYDNAYAEEQESGRWALSVFSWPGWTAAEIADSWRYQGQPMQETTAGELRSAGFDVIPEPRWEGDTHALLMLEGEPTEETWERLRPCFGPVMPNPHYRNRPGRRQ